MIRVAALLAVATPVSADSFLVCRAETRCETPCTAYGECGEPSCRIVIDEIEAKVAIDRTVEGDVLRVSSDDPIAVVEIEDPYAEWFPDTGPNLTWVEVDDAGPLALAYTPSTGAFVLGFELYDRNVDYFGTCAQPARS